MYTVKRTLIGRCALVCALCFVGLTACDVDAGGSKNESEWPADLDTARNVDYLPDIDKDLIFELNKLRYDPVRYCKEVGLPSLDGLTPEEEFLQDKAGRGYTKSYPLLKLYPSKGLWLAAFDNNHNQQIKGGIGHTEWSGRINGRYGTSGGGIGENAGPPNIANQASGGAATAARIVNEMIRDRGVANKGHRTNCMDAKWNVVGASAINDVNASHGYVTFDFADSFTDNGGAAECDIQFAAVAYNDGGETKSIKLTFSKAVDLKAEHITFVGVDAADPETTAPAGAGHIILSIEGTNPGYNPGDDGGTHTIWWVVVKTLHSGNVTLSVNIPGLKVRPWPRTLAVSKPSTFTTLDAMKTFLGTQTAKGTAAANPVSVTLEGAALTGADDTAKVKSLYDAILDANKFVSVNLNGVTGLTTWPQITSDGIKKITAITLPMPSENNAPVNTSIGVSAFSAAESLTFVYSFNVTAVGANAFNGCAALKEVMLPRTGASSASYDSGEPYTNATAIGQGAFTNCTALTTVGVGSNLTLSGTGLPAGMITKYEDESKKGGYNSSGDVAYVLNAGVWAKRN